MLKADSSTFSNASSSKLPASPARPVPSGKDLFFDNDDEEDCLCPVAKLNLNRTPTYHVKDTGPAFDVGSFDDFPELSCSASQSTTETTNPAAKPAAESAREPSAESMATVVMHGLPLTVDQTMLQDIVKGYGELHSCVFTEAEGCLTATMV